MSIFGTLILIVLIISSNIVCFYDGYKKGIDDLGDAIKDVLKDELKRLNDETGNNSKD